MSINDITGDELVTKSATDAYRDGWERIFGNMNEVRDYRVIEDLPEEEREPFRYWLKGQVVPINNDGSYGFYEGDYKHWLKFNKK